MPPTLKVRTACQNDQPRVLDLYKHLHDHDESADPQALETAWNQVITSSCMRLLVAETDNLLVASCALSILPNLTRGCRPYGLIENVVTHANYRRLGYGRRVMQHALSGAWEAGCYKVMLLTGRNEAGVHRFYEKCGFVPGVKTGYIAKPSEANH